MSIFIGAPSDVAAEVALARQVVQNLNVGGPPPAVFNWKDDATPGIGTPQRLIDRDLEQADVAIFIFWNRIGSPTPAAVSGTVGELLRIFERWKTVRGPRQAEALVYFCQRGASFTTLEELRQKMGVLWLRSALSSVALWCDFDTPEQFEQRLRQDLTDLTRGRRRRGRTVSRPAGAGLWACATWSPADPPLEDASQARQSTPFRRQLLQMHLEPLVGALHELADHPRTASDFDPFAKDVHAALFDRDAPAGSRRARAGLTVFALCGDKGRPEVASRYYESFYEFARSSHTQEKGRRRVRVCRIFVPLGQASSLTQAQRAAVKAHERHRQVGVRALRITAARRNELAKSNSLAGVVAGINRDDGFGFVLLVPNAGPPQAFTHRRLPEHHTRHVWRDPRNLACFAPLVLELLAATEGWAARSRLAEWRQVVELLGRCRPS